MRLEQPIRQTKDNVTHILLSMCCIITGSETSRKNNCGVAHFLVVKRLRLSGKEKCIGTNQLLVITCDTMRLPEKTIASLTICWLWDGMWCDCLKIAGLLTPCWPWRIFIVIGWWRKCSLTHILFTSYWSWHKCMKCLVKKKCRITHTLLVMG